MNLLIHKFRGLGIALAVLAISAGAAFAATPAMRPVASTSTHGDTASATETPEPTETPEATETPEPTETPEATKTPDATGTPTGTAAPTKSPNPDTHGALVSTAAQMPTPSGFPNHGAFVSCVAHLDTTLAKIVWTTVTPASCGITTTTPTQHGNSASSHGNDASAATGKAHGAAGRAHAHSH
jgi:hypothetical protein